MKHLDIAYVSGLLSKKRNEVDYFIRFFNGSWLYWLVPLVILAAIVRYTIKKQVTYRYSLGSFLSARRAGTRHPYKKILYGCRFLLLCVLALTAARPQLVDSRSQITVEGVDIMIALDLSGSMNSQDFENDPRTRIEIAQQEAIRFIQKRTNDAIGLVIFGADAISRCPITHDKKLLEAIVKQSSVGSINHDGTVLSTALITAASRLRNSKAKSKIIILLTDGEPSEGDMNPEKAIEVAQKMGIKIYTIGIGSDQPQIIQSFFGPMRIPPTINSDLLKKIASHTKGQYFVARNATEMQAVYDTIDQLEKTEITTPLFSNQHEVGIWGILAAFVLVCSEIILSTFIWFSL